MAASIEKRTVCVVGSGVAGLTAATLLARRNQQVTLIESEERLGGHALTVKAGDNLPPVDLGFQVYNLTTYPLLTKLFDELGVETEPSEMSFSCSSETSEWASHGLKSFLATKSNAISPKFWSMVREMFRFGKEAKEHLPALNEDESLGDYLKRNKYSDTFAQDYLLPMTAAVWSVPYNKMLAFPAKALISFWNNHHLLDPVGERPRWRVVSKRSGDYVVAVEKELRRLGVTIHLNTKVASCKNRTTEGMTLVFADGREETFDRVVFCTHSDITAQILGAEATSEEAASLGAVGYEPNRVVLHSDLALMPRSTDAWASWNVLQRTNHDNDTAVCVTYWLNRLQNLPEGTKTLLCTLNPIVAIDPKSILLDMTLSHPIFNAPAMEAQRQINELQGNVELGKSRVVWFGGAWLGNGFHEDGVRSALNVAQGMCPVQDGMDTSDWSLSSRGPLPVSGTRAQSIGMTVFQYVAEKSIKQGHLRIILPSGDELGPFGRSTREEAFRLNEPVCELRVLDLSMFWRIVRDSDIGLGEAYMERLFELPRGHRDLDGLFRILLDNRTRFAETLGMNSVVAGPLALVASGLYKVGNIIHSIQHSWRRNTIEGSRQNIHEHYDLGNDFYKLFLDETMTYSAGIHSSPEQPLKDAQLAKYDRIIAKAKLNKDSRVLEIGCGWGGLAHRAVETTGCRVWGVTISQEQLDYAKKRAIDNKFDDRVEFLFCDYRNIPTTLEPSSFDAVVSIEMLEAVGHENLPHFFDVVSKMLKPGAPAVIQVIGMPNERYEEYMNSSDFIRRHIFPGGHLPCMNALEGAIIHTDLSLGEVFDIGPDYAESLLEWRLRFFAQRRKLLEMNFSEKFIRKWLFYFAYCEMGFRKKYIHDWQIVFEKHSNPKARPVAEARKSTTTRDLSTDYANYAPSNSWDFITGMFFGAWFVLCAFAVMEKGRHLLVIPACMISAILGHVALGSTKAPKKYELGALISNASVAGISLLTLANSDWKETIVLIGAGLYCADLIALVWSGTYSPRLIRVIFAAIELSFLGITSFYGSKGAANLHNLMFMHLLLTSLFHSVIHAIVLDESNRTMRALLPVTLVGCMALHAWGVVKTEDALPKLFSVAAVGYDAVAALGVTSALTKKIV